MYEQLEAALRRAVDSTGSPGAVLYVGDREQTYAHIAYGLRQRVPVRHPAEKDTLYDLASLTKVIATTTAVMILRDEGDIELDQPVTDFVPIPAFSHISLRHLLTHTSGLTPGEHYYEFATSLEEMFQIYAVEGLIVAENHEERYSDVGFMLLGKIVELVTRDRLDRFCDKRIFQPLGMKRTAFNPPKEWAQNCAATEDDPWRGRVILGEVHDPNTWAVGGVSGQAGLFSTAEDLAAFSRALLSGEILSEATLDEMTTLGTVPFYPWRGLGWQMDPWSSKAIGFLPSRRAFGHTGWTGTSMWLDRGTGLFTILLGNTCHPSRARRDNARFRRIAHTAVSKTFYPGVSTTHSGLDRLVRENYRVVDDKQIGLLTNHAAIDQLDRHILDVLDLTGAAKLKYIFSPEHGLRGLAEAGEHVESQNGPVPVISLYGSRKEPTEEELSSLELFVVDLQDVGARYYTYMATMKRCMAACAKAKVPVLVLDRPNPLGGTVLEGPIATRTDSLVCSAAIPIRHGMTMGELALFFAQNELKDSRIHLEINLLDNWPPERLFDECSLTWIPPSPNIPTPETALLYIGMCLFEGTNLNEGRGTDSPFHLIGAPWLDAEQIAHALDPADINGCEITATTYIPRAIPGKASNPRYKDIECNGLRIAVTNAHAVRPFTVAVAMLCAISKTHPDDFAWDGSPPFDTLAGGPALRQSIQAGRTAAEIVAAYAPELQRFDSKRPRLYDQDGIPL